MFIYFNPDGISRFYKTLRFMEFALLSEQKIDEIDKMAQIKRQEFLNGAPALGTLMSLCAESLTKPPQNLVFNNSDEVLYYYMQIVDPDFLFLEVYECASQKKDIEPLCLQNLGLYDPFLIYYEVIFKRRFSPKKLEDLWLRGKIEPLDDKHGIAK